MAVPNFMFEPIVPQLTLWERFQEWRQDRGNTEMSRKTNVEKLRAAQQKSLAAFKARHSAIGRRDGTAPAKQRALVRCVTAELRAELDFDAAVA